MTNDPEGARPFVNERWRISPTGSSGPRLVQPRGEEEIPAHPSLVGPHDAPKDHPRTRMETRPLEGVEQAGPPGDLPAGSLECATW